MKTVNQVSTKTEKSKSASDRPEVLRMPYGQLCSVAKKLQMTVKQLVIIELMAADYAIKSIAGLEIPGDDSLGNSYTTIRQHINRLKVKFGVEEDYGLVAAYAKIRADLLRSVGAGSRRTFPVPIRSRGILHPSMDRFAFRNVYGVVSIKVAPQGLNSSDEVSLAA